jgi:hypothetical protein
MRLKRPWDSQVKWALASEVPAGPLRLHLAGHSRERSGILHQIRDIGEILGGQGVYSSRQPRGVRSARRA